MAILTVNESADMLKRLATNVMDHGDSMYLYPSYAQAILDVLAALEDAQKQLAAVPVKAIMTFFDSGDRCTQEQIDAIDAWLNTKVQP